MRIGIEWKIWITVCARARVCVYVPVRRKGAGGRWASNPTMKGWMSVCSEEGQATDALGRDVSVRQNNTHSGCGCENDRHGWGGFREEGSV